MEKQKVYHSKLNSFNNPEDRFIILESSMNDKRDFVFIVKEELAYQGITGNDLSILTGIHTKKIARFLRRGTVKLTDWEIHKIKTKLGM